MSENKHSPEPWAYSYDGVDRDGDLEQVDVYTVGNEDNSILQSCDCCHGLGCSKADIERIIACVNACEGHDPAIVRKLLDHISEQLEIANAATEPCTPPETA